MKISKLFAAMAASAVSVSALAAMSLSANAAADEYPENFKVMLAGTWGGVNLGWSDADAKDENSVVVDKNGTYTITVDSSQGGETGNATWAMALRTVGFSAFDYGDEGDDFATCIEKGGITFTVDSVKISGQEKLTGKSEVVADDDGSNMRANIYNKWGNDYAIVDAVQLFDGDVEVTFTVSGLKFGAQTGTDTSSTTTSADATTTTTTTTGTAGGNTTTQAPAPTGDAGVGIAVGALAVAAGAAFALRKKN